MPDHLELQILPAGNGDCLWIEYGDPHRPRRILVDGGTQGTYKRLKKKIESLDAADRRFELLVVSHIDSDHIAGALELLERNELGVTIDDVWFNGYRHLQADTLQDFGVLQGERLTTALLTQGLAWNAAFGGKRVSVADDGRPVRKELRDGLELYVLGPGLEQLAKLRPVWEKECEEAGLDPQRPVEEQTALPPGLQSMGALSVDQLAAARFVEDSAPANGSSIALLLRYQGKSMLLAGDAHPTMIIAGAAKLEAGVPLEVDILKLPHHGSQNNVSSALIEGVRAKQYVFSSNGATFGHPDPEGVARAIKYGRAGARLVFNYRTPINAVWDDASLRRRHKFSLQYGDGESPVVLGLI